jgi:hypothetical protein
MEAAAICGGWPRVPTLLWLAKGWTDVYPETHDIESASAISGGAGVAP